MDLGSDLLPPDQADIQAAGTGTGLYEQAASGTGIQQNEQQDQAGTTRLPT